MASILTDILKPSVVTKIVSRIRTPGDHLSRWYGIGIGGANITPVTIPGLRQYSYDIYDKVRKVARPRLAFAPAGTIAANPVGNNTVTLARVAEKLPMDYNKISAIRELGENAGIVDRMGRKYVEKQAETLKIRQDNFRELVAGSLLRGGIYYIHQSGDDLLASYTSTSALASVDLLIPSTHKLIGGAFAAGLALDGSNNTITATWATATNDIPLMLEKMSAGFESSVGAPLSDIWCNHTVWLNVLKNDYVKALAGAAASPFAEWYREDMKLEDGTPSGKQIGRIKGLEWLTWHITNHQLEVYDGSTETAVKIVPDDYCLFTIQKGDWLCGVEGTEIIKVNDLAPPKPETGFVSWMMEKADPARFELHGLQNFALELNVPKSVAVARVQ